MTRSEFLKFAGAGVAGTVLLGGAYVLWRAPGQVSGALAGVARDVSRGPHRVGEFIVELEAGPSEDASDNRLSITHRSDPERVLWSSVRGESFVCAARGEETVSGSSGHFYVEDEVRQLRADQTIDSIEERGSSLVVAGRLVGDGEDRGYTLALSPVTGGRLRFVATVEEPFNRL